MNGWIRLFGVSVGALVIFGCVGLDQMVQNDPIAAVQSAAKVTQALVTASRDITEEEEISLGRTVSARLLAKYPLSQNSYLHTYVNLVGTTVAMVSDRPDLEYHFAVLDTPEVNAFAAPGGYIFVTRGMLEGLDSEDQLAAILAHEIGHICAKHSLESIKGDLWKQVVIITAQETAKSQGTNPELVNLLGQASDRILDTLINVGYSQPQEFEADRLGQTFTARAGYQGEALRQCLSQMADRERTNDRTLSAMLGTHPSFSARLAKLPPQPDLPPDAAFEFRSERFKESTR